MSWNLIKRNFNFGKVIILCKNFTNNIFFTKNKINQEKFWKTRE